jgi:soluble P-type ATPase
LHSNNIKQSLKVPLKRFSTTVIAIGVSGFMLLYYLYPKEKLAVMSVGKGNSVVLNLEENTVVIGAGDGENDIIKIKNALLTFGKSEADILILPSLDKSNAGGGAAFVTEFSNTAVILPCEGEFSDKLNYVDNGKFTYFKDNIALPLGANGEVLIYKDKGVIINLRNRSFIIYFGDNLSDIYCDVKNEDITLICAGNIPKDVKNFAFSNIILSGDAEKMQSLKKII